MTQGLWRSPGKEVRALTDRIGRDDQFEIAVDSRHGTIVSNAKTNIITAPAATGEKMFDQRKFIHTARISAGILRLYPAPH